MRFLKAALVAMVDAGLVVDMASGRVGPAGMGGGGNGEQSDKCCGDVFHGDLLVESLLTAPPRLKPGDSRGSTMAGSFH